MTLGDKESESARTHSLEDIAAILDVFQKHGHKEASVIIVVYCRADRFPLGRYCQSIHEWYFGATPRGYWLAAT